MDIETELIRIENGFWEAAGDRRFYEENMSDNGLLIFAGAGAIVDKPSVLPMIENSEPWASYELENVRLIRLGDDAAAIIYSAKGDRADSAEYRANITSVYVRHDGNWKLVLHQQTPFD